MSLDEALSVLAADICVQIAPSIATVCRTLCTYSTPNTDTHCTWVCKDTNFFTLFKVDKSSTLLYSHTNEVLYYASMLAQLSPSCPLNVGFLCQFTHDSLPEGLVPRLLVFDIISPTALPAEARGDYMRALATHIPQPLCCVQWIGPRRYLSDEFIRGLPHEMQGILYIGDDPLSVKVEK
jgi:hypothetical protein